MIDTNSRCRIQVFVYPYVTIIRIGGIYVMVLSLSVEIILYLGVYVIENFVDD